MEKVTVELRNEDKLRWLRVTLSLLESPPENRYPVRASDVVCEVIGLDALAKSYNIDNWESGLMSGLSFGFRRLIGSWRAVQFGEIRGALRAADMEALSWAGTIAALELAQKDRSEFSTPGWSVTVSRESSSQSPLLNGDPRSSELSKSL
ncbi:MAG TPA: hypothetical protein VKS79_03120 [Gemmataceae bacterium]|nr:hypothetical protein [Gemmataceae bacterium]